jgi:hypothetical protein
MTPSTLAPTAANVRPVGVKTTHNSCTNGRLYILAFAASCQADPGLYFRYRTSAHAAGINTPLFTAVKIATPVELCLTAYHASSLAVTASRMPGPRLMSTKTSDTADSRHNIVYDSSGNTTATIIEMSSDACPVAGYTDVSSLVRDGPWMLFHTPSRMITIINSFVASIRAASLEGCDSDLLGIKPPQDVQKPRDHPQSVQDILRHANPPQTTFASRAASLDAIVPANMATFELQVYTLFVILLSLPLRRDLAAASPKAVADRIFLRFDEYMAPYLFGDATTALLGPAELAPRFIYDLRMMYGQATNAPCN